MSVITSNLNALMWQGQFFQKKSCEADEKSNEIIFETRLV